MKEAYKPKVGRYVNFGVIFIGMLYLIPGIILFLMYRSDPSGLTSFLSLTPRRNSRRDFDEFTSGFSLLHYHCDHNAHHFMGIVSSSFASVLPNFGNQSRFVHGIGLICIEHRDGKFFVKDMYRFWTRTLQVVLLTVLGFYIPIFSSINAINILKHMNE